MQKVSMLFAYFVDVDFKFYLFLKKALVFFFTLVFLKNSKNLNIYIALI